jgi:hypothetical protein
VEFESVSITHVLKHLRLCELSSWVSSRDVLIVMFAAVAAEEFINQFRRWVLALERENPEVSRGCVHHAQVCNVAFDAFITVSLDG